MKAIKFRLIVMNFLIFAVWGAYLCSLGIYLGRIGMGANIGKFFAIQGVVSLFMPALMGIVADRWIPAQKLLGICHFLAAIFMALAGYMGYKYGSAVSFGQLFPYYAISVAFGVRNFEHLQLGLNEMNRVLRPGALVCIVELSVPSNPILLWGYKLYFLHVLPFIGGLISGNREAYKYLPNSVLHFPKPEKVCEMLRLAGFERVEAKAFTFGLCRMFTGVKK